MPFFAWLMFGLTSHWKRFRISGSSRIGNYPARQAHHALGNSGSRQTSLFLIHITSAWKPVRVSTACLLVAGIAGAGSLLLLRGFGPQQLPDHLAAITVDYPSEGSIFPPEITPPTFLWRDPSGPATSTLHGCRWRGRVVEGRKFTRDSYGTDSIIGRHERRGIQTPVWPRNGDLPLWYALLTDEGP